MKCIVCGEDNAPEVHFDVPVICTDCARIQLQRMSCEIDPSEQPEVEAPRS